MLDMILGSLRDYAGRRLTDEVLLDLDRNDQFPRDVIAEMCGPDLGIHLLFVAERFGGLGGGALDIYRVCEEMGRIDLGIATALFATHLGSEPISVGGTEEQKARWLGRIAEEGILMAYGATEPEAGSDLGRLRTIARPVEQDGEVVAYELTGAKQWISNGSYAELYTILANAPGGPSWFVVERGQEGFTPGKPEEKHGIRASNTAALSLDRVRVEADRLVGGVEGRGLTQAKAVFGYTRLMVAAFGLGAGWAALDRAIPYSVERVQGGGPLSEKQGYTHKLIVPHAVDLEAGRAFIELVAERLDGGERELDAEGAIAKYIATEAGNRAADAAIQALGGYGYTHEYMVEKIRRDVRITMIYEGTSEILEMTVGRARWQDHLKTRGLFYRQRAADLSALHAQDPTVGANLAGLGTMALATLLDQFQVHRLTRHQHVLFRMGALAAQVEAAEALARRAARAGRGEAHPKTLDRFHPSVQAAVSRIYARRAALHVLDEGLAWVCGADGLAADQVEAFARSMGAMEIYRAQSGLIADMNQVADALYDRA